MFSPEKAIPIPIYDNRDEAATHLWPILMGGSLKRQSLRDALRRLGMVANAGHWLNMYCAGMTKGKTKPVRIELYSDIAGHGL